MTHKARKHIWPGGLVMAIAVAGVLAVFAVLASGSGAAVAHQAEDHDAACAGMTADERAAHNKRERIQANLDGRAPVLCSDMAGATPTPTRPAADPEPTPSGPSASGDAAELPGMVRELMVRAYSEGTPQEELEVTWTAPADGGFVDGYRIDLSDDGERWVSYIPNTGGSDLSLIYGDDVGEMLMAEQTKHFRVFALVEGAAGPGTDASGTTDASWAPERPTELTATQGAYRTSIMLSWDAPEDPPGAPVEDYRIEYSRDGNQWRHLDDTGRSPTSFYHTGLNANVEMQYRIYAMNSVGQSDVSDGATGNTAASKAPEMPTNPVIGLSPAATDVHLKWTPPHDPDGDKVSHYRVQARKSDQSPEADWKPLHGGKVIARTSEYNFGGDDLREHAGISYPQSIAADEDALVYIDIRVAAINQMNTSSADDASDVAWLTVENVPVGHEDAPKKAGVPEVKHDEGEHQGRSGLDVTWPKAAFIQNRGPSDTRFGSTVHYILVTNDVEADEVTHTAALALGGNNEKPGADDNGLATETVRTYHVYAVNKDVDNLVRGVSVRSFPSNMKKGKTARPQLPGRPEDFTVTADGHTEIRLEWGAPMTDDQQNRCESTDAPPTEDDGSECGGSVITGYQLEMSRTGTGGWQILKSNDKDDKTPETIEASPYIAEMLMPGQRYHFRVAALNSRGQGPYSEVRSEETHEAGEPTPPGGLVAQAYGTTAIKLCWVEQNLVDPLTGEMRLDEGLPVLGYKITYQMHSMDADGNETIGPEMTRVEDTRSNNTQYTAMGLMPGTKYTFKVYSITLGGVGEEAAEASASTADAMVPAAPTDVTATADSDTQITVTWTAPADPAGAPVTGYIIERRYTGDMMGDIPSDGYSGTDGANRSFAFSNAMEWWETLNCKGMLAAAGSTEDPTGSGPDKMMYCGHFLNTEPSNVSDSSQELSDDAKAAVEVLFNKRYELPTGTGTTFVDMGLMEQTEYTYRVSAVNAAGRSPWSDADSATTQATSTELTKPTGVMVEVDDSDPGAIDVTVNWTDGENAANHMVILFAYPSFEIGEGHIATNQTDGTTTFNDVPAGTYVAVVVAIKSRSEYEYEHKTVEVGQ